MKCPKCSLPATHAPKVRVPAQGYPLTTHTPLSVFANLQLCEKHARLTPVRKILTEETKDRIIEATKERGLAYPSFRRAYMEATPVDSEEFQSFLASLHPKS